MNNHYIDTGDGPETIVFAHGFLFSSAMFEPQIEHLRTNYRCVAYDHRGQGQSPVADGGYDIDTLTDDAIALIEELGVGPCHFVGLSMGGMVGMRVALKRPDLVKSLALISTTPFGTPKDVAKGYGMLALMGRLFGFGMLAKKVAPMMFGQDFMTDPARAAERKHWIDVIGANSRKGASRTIKGLTLAADISADLAQLNIPVIYIAGEQEAALPPEISAKTQALISGCQLAMVPNAGHSSTIEQPAAVNAILSRFFDAQ